MTEAQKITVRQFIDMAKLKEDLSYTTINLSDAMMRQASLFAHYGELAAKSSRQVDNIKMLLDNIEAQVYRVIRDGMVNRGEKVTEAQVEKQVTRHERVRAVNRALNEAKQIESVAKTAVEAFRHRRDMLIQQGLIMREEMKGELSIQQKRESEAHVDDLKEKYLKRAADRSIAA